MSRTALVVCGCIAAIVWAGFVIFGLGAVGAAMLGHEGVNALGNIFLTILLLATAAVPVVCFILFLTDVRRLGLRLERRRAGLSEKCGHAYPVGSTECPACGVTLVLGVGSGRQRSPRCATCRYPRVVKPGEPQDEWVVCPECGARYV